MDSSSSLPPRRRLPDDDDDLEEGQFVFVPTAYQQSSHPDHDDAHYRRRRLSLHELLALGRGDPLPSPTPSCESDGTISVRLRGGGARPRRGGAQRGQGRHRQPRLDRGQASAFLGGGRAASGCPIEPLLLV